MDSINYLITAKHYCQREGAKSVKERILKLHVKRQKKSNFPLPIQIHNTVSRPVYARIELGQVVADCECGGCEFVDREEPIFYCFNCFNRVDNGALRPVIFPDEGTWNEIVRLVLLRPVNDIRGADPADRAAASRAVIYMEQENGMHLPLTRSWNPHETIDDLIRENEPIEKWVAAQMKGVP